MKRIILGKALFLLIISYAFADNNVVVDKTQFYPGDAVTFTINAKGNNVKFPSINTIAGFRVIGNSSSTSIEFINGKRRQIKSQSYSFKPSKSLTIGAFNLKIDGKNEKTRPIKLTLLKPKKSQKDDDFILRMKANKTEFFMGEKINLQVIFKQKKSAALKGKIEIQQPNAQGLTVKPSSKNFAKSADAHYHIYTQNHQVIAHQAGVFTLAPILAVVNKNAQNIFSAFGGRQQTARKKFYSNPILLTIKALPDNLEIYGSFKINASTDKTEVKAGEALNLTLSITGDGNLSDIEKFALNIENTTVYTDEAKVKNRKWTQKFAIVAQEDFVIPALSLDFFDKNTRSKKTIGTQPIKIQVFALQTSSNFPTSLTPPTSLPPKLSYLKYYYLFSGILLGMLIIGLIFVVKRINRGHKNQNLVKQIKNTRGNRALFDLLLPLHQVELKPFLQQLEGNLYKNQNHKIDKKAVIKSLKT